MLNDGLSVVGAAAGVVCVVAAIVLYTVGQNEIPRLTAALWVTGIAGLMNSTIGPTINRFATGIDDRLGEAVNSLVGETITGGLGFLVILPAFFWIRRNQLQAKELLVLAAIPPTVSLIPGTFGQVVTTVVGIVPWLIDWSISWLLNLA